MELQHDAAEHARTPHDVHGDGGVGDVPATAHGADRVVEVAGVQWEGSVDDARVVVHLHREGEHGRDGEVGIERRGQSVLRKREKRVNIEGARDIRQWRDVARRVVEVEADLRQTDPLVRQRVVVDFQHRQSVHVVRVVLEGHLETLVLAARPEDVLLRVQPRPRPVLDSVEHPIPRVVLRQRAREQTVPVDHLVAEGGEGDLDRLERSQREKDFRRGVVVDQGKERVGHGGRQGESVIPRELRGGCGEELREDVEAGGVRDGRVRDRRENVAALAQCVHGAGEGVRLAARRRTQRGGTVVQTVREEQRAVEVHADAVVGEDGDLNPVVVGRGRVQERRAHEHVRAGGEGAELPARQPGGVVEGHVEPALRRR